MQKSIKSKLAYISVIGTPNAGKSTFINHVVQKEVSIVTYKPQTTRNVIKGIVNNNETQLIFLDTPGIFTPENTLGNMMMKSTFIALNTANIVLAIIDGANSLSNIEKDIQKITSIIPQDLYLCIVINKIDLIKKEKEEEILQLLCYQKLAKIFFISCKNAIGITDLMSFLFSSATPSEWIYKQLPQEKTSFISEEATRKVIILSLKQELPYNVLVQTNKVEENKHDIVIEQDIVVSKKSHKIILIGKKGHMIKKIREKSEEEITRITTKKCYIKLFVKLDPECLDKIHYMPFE